MRPCSGHSPARRGQVDPGTHRWAGGFGWIQWTDGSADGAGAQMQLTLAQATPCQDGLAAATRRLCLCFRDLQFQPLPTSIKHRPTTKRHGACPIEPLEYPNPPIFNKPALPPSITIFPESLVSTVEKNLRTGCPRLLISGPRRHPRICCNPTTNCASNFTSTFSGQFARFRSLHPSP